MAKMTKKEAIAIVVECAEKYKKNLVNRCILFVCMDKHKRISWLEVTFDASNFLHLTGLKIKGNKIKAKDFFNRCLDHELREEDFEFPQDGTASMKLSVLPSLMQPNLSASCIGDYNAYNPKLYTDKLAGNVKACIGFVKSFPGGRYVPNTTLKADVRQYIESPLRIITAYRKMKWEDGYTELIYKAKKVDWVKVQYPKEIQAIIHIKKVS